MTRMQTHDGRQVIILQPRKHGMSIFAMFGLLAGSPCHWTADGRYRMDGKDDPRDLVYVDRGKIAPDFSANVPLDEESGK